MTARVRCRCSEGRESERQGSPEHHQLALEGVDGNSRAREVCRSQGRATRQQICLLFN